MGALPSQPAQVQHSERDAEATVRLMLLYERPGYRDRTRKELTLINQSGNWQISRETNLEVEVLDAGN